MRNAIVQEEPVSREDQGQHLRPAIAATGGVLVGLLAYALCGLLLVWSMHPSNYPHGVAGIAAGVAVLLVTGILVWSCRRFRRAYAFGVATAVIAVTAMVLALPPSPDIVAGAWEISSFWQAPGRFLLGPVLAVAAVGANHRLRRTTR